MIAIELDLDRFLSEFLSDMSVKYSLGPNLCSYVYCFEDNDVPSFPLLTFLYAFIHPSLHVPVTVSHLVLGIHLGHHAVLQQVESEHLQDVQLVGHLIVDGCGAPDHALHRVKDEQRGKRGRWKSRGEEDREVSGSVRCANGSQVSGSERREMDFGGKRHEIK